MNFMYMSCRDTGQWRFVRQREGRERRKNCNAIDFHFTKNLVPSRVKLKSDLAIRKEIFVPL